MSVTTWWWVSGPRWTFGIRDVDNVVVETAPISDWARGKPIGKVLRWWKNKGADCVRRLEIP